MIEARRRFTRRSYGAQPPLFMSAIKPFASILRRLEPVAGLEPATDGLQNRCSTTELNWQYPANMSPVPGPAARQFSGPDKQAIRVESGLGRGIGESFSIISGFARPRQPKCWTEFCGLDNLAREPDCETFLQARYKTAKGNL
jgi:hypothetical protein